MGKTQSKDGARETTWSEIFELNVELYTMFTNLARATFID